MTGLTETAAVSTALTTVDAGGFTVFQQKVKGTNINEQTLLATDYLNHFNEIMMILEMIPDLPDCLEDAREWRPKSYQEHFRDSSFSDRDLAIAAYEHAPSGRRDLFEDTVSHMNRLVAAGLERIERALGTGECETVACAVRQVSHSLQKLIDIASAIIHGDKPTMEQDEIDQMIGV